MATKMQELFAEIREETGTRQAKKLRREGYVPSVLYGLKREPLALKVKYKELEKVLSTEAGLNVIINLKIKSSKKNEEQPAITCALDRDVITDKIIHVDFHALELKEKIQTQVPITFVGEAPGVKAGGILLTLLREIKIECLPLDIPSHFELDISSLEINKSLHVSDIKVDTDKIKILTPSTDVIVSCVVPKEEVEEVAVPEGVQPEVVGKEKEKEEEEVKAEEEKVEPTKGKAEKVEKPAKEGQKEEK